jgi:DNA (cytosine-5)-methyltransferase 1
MHGTSAHDTRHSLSPSPSVVSLFTGAMGLDLGFEQAGWEIRVCVDADRFAAATIRANRPRVPVINHDIRRVPTSQILRAAGLGPGGPTCVIGGPPCSPFTYGGSRRGLADLRGTLVFEFIRVVREAGPEFFVFENVPGLARAALKHISCYLRRSGTVKIAPEERLGSAFEQILSAFSETGYDVVSTIVDAADFGVPQHRRRLLILGSRAGVPFPLPTQTHAAPDDPRVIRGDLRPWRTLRDAIGELRDPKAEHVGFPPNWARFMDLIPEGGDWRALPDGLRKEAMGNAYHSWGGRSGFLRRLRWDRPSPTLMSTPDMKACSLAHPEFSRPLSVPEYSRLQAFPDSWILTGTTPTRYRLVGQAVPVGLAFAVASRLLGQIARSPRYKLLGQSTKTSIGKP